MKKSVRDKLYERFDQNNVEFGQLLQHVERERRLLHSIFNLLQEAVLLVDTQGNIEFYNESARLLLRLPQENKAIPTLWHWLPNLKGFFEPRDNAIYPDVSSKEMSLSYPENKQVRVHIQALREEEQPIRFIVLIQDITQETQKTEERVFQEKTDSIVQLASEVAHELGNPLNSLGIHLQLMQRALKTKSDTDKLSRSLQVCQSEIHRLDEIIQHFLQAVRPQCCKLQKGSVVPIIKKVLEVVKPQLDNLNIAIDLDIKGNLPLIYLDPARVHQALFNVIKNAIEAIGSNGWIRISCYLSDTHLIVACADSGCGISGTQAMRMTTSNNQTTKNLGHGIGMLIIQRVMREHNGSLDLESKEKLGSILYLRFPLIEQNLRKLQNTTNS